MSSRSACLLYAIAPYIDMSDDKKQKTVMKILQNGGGGACMRAVE